MDTVSPPISVIIPTSGRQELLLACVASVINGSYQNYEILVVDQDPGRVLERRLCENFPGVKQLTYLFLERSGASRARNFGVAHAKGSIVAFIDDDAVADQGWLNAIADIFTTIEPQPGLMGGRIDPVWPGERPSWYPSACEVLLGLYNIGDDIRPMPTHDQPIAANMAGLRHVIVELGGFEESLGPNYFRKRPMLTGEETILAQRARRAGYSIYYHPWARVRHRISRTKLTRPYFLRRHFWEGVTVITEMFYMGDLRAGRRRHLAYHIREAARNLVHSIAPRVVQTGEHTVSAARMLALSRSVFSCGVIYGLATLPGAQKA